MSQIAMEIRTWKDYKSEVKPTWCSGCGDFGVLHAAYKAFADLNLDPEKMVLVSGIGCSSRFPYFVKSYGMHTAHGRALPVAAGVKTARPDLDVLVFGGDGDGFSIGGGHVPHVARRNVNITYVLMDNGIYGLTKGQVSPTSNFGMKTNTTPYGAPDVALNPLAYVLTYGASFVAQAYAGKSKVIAELIKKGIEHEGFSFINVISPCPTFNKEQTFDYFKEQVVDIEGHDPSNFAAAMDLAVNGLKNQKIYQGILYQEKRATQDHSLAEIRKKAGASPEYDLNKIIDIYKP